MVRNNFCLFNQIKKSNVSNWFKYWFQLQGKSYLCVLNKIQNWLLYKRQRFWAIERYIIYIFFCLLNGQYLTFLIILIWYPFSPEDILHWFADFKNEVKNYETICCKPTVIGDCFPFLFSSDRIVCSFLYSCQSISVCGQLSR